MKRLLPRRRRNKVGYEIHFFFFFFLYTPCCFIGGLRRMKVMIGWNLKNSFIKRRPMAIVNSDRSRILFSSNSIRDCPKSTPKYGDDGHNSESGHQCLLTGSSSLGLCPSRYGDQREGGGSRRRVPYLLKLQWNSFLWSDFIIAFGLSWTDRSIETFINHDFLVTL